MKKIKLYSYLIILIYTVCIYCQSTIKLNQTRITEDLFYTKIQDSVYMYTHYFPYACNGMFVLLPGNRGVLINTPCESSGTISLLDWIEKSFGNIKLTAIVTGFHQDNLGGDEILLSKDIPVYGSDLTVRLINEQGAGLKEVVLNSVSKEENKKYYNSYKTLKLIPPDSIYQIRKGLNLKIGGEIFELFYPGESHTKDNIVVYLRKRKILFGGCMIKGLEFDNPGYTGYANMIEWPKSVEKVMNKFKDAYVVIPGHGTPGGKELLPHTIKVLNDWNNRTSKNNNL